MIMPDFKGFEASQPSPQHPRVVVEVDLAKLGLPEYDSEGDPMGPTTFRQEVVEAAARMLRADAADSRRALGERVKEIRDDEIRAQVAAEVRAVLAEPIQRTTKWNEPQGPPVTIRELIREELEKFLNGKATFSMTDPYTSQKKPHSLADLLTEITKEALRTEFTADIREAKKVIAEQVKQIATETAAKLLTKDR
jgi:predicted component of type VI protein secretion system